MMTEEERIKLGGRIMSTVDDAVTVAMAKPTAGLGLPQLHWSIAPANDGWRHLSGLAADGDYSEGEVPVALGQWVEKLGLEPVDRPIPGTVEYIGSLGFLLITVWGVVNREMFERRSTT